MYIEQLRQTAKKNKSILCMGMDPEIEKIPFKEDSVRKTLVTFYFNILQKVHNHIGAVKPNIAFYEQYGFEGLEALREIIDMAKSLHLPVILDAKRGDIGKTSSAYAKAVYDVWGADCVTLAPYMGTDSVGPFLEYSKTKGKGAYILCRTSNAGAADFQSLTIDGDPLYLRVGKKIVEWSHPCHGNVGAVVGATSEAELTEMALHFGKLDHAIPLLIPGVGKQGGSAKTVTDILRKTGKDLSIHRINSSSDINFAYEKYGGDYAEAALRRVLELNKEIGY